MTYNVVACAIVVTAEEDVLKTWATQNRATKAKINEIIDQGGVTLIGTSSKEGMNILFGESDYVTFDETNRRVFFHTDFDLFRRTDAVKAEQLAEKARYAAERASRRLQEADPLTIPWTALFPELKWKQTLFVDAIKLRSGGRTRTAKLCIEPSEKNMKRVRDVLAPYGVTDIRAHLTTPDHGWTEPENVIRCKW